MGVNEQTGETDRPVRADDDSLVSALRAGDERVFTRLVDAWSPAMMRLARLHVANREAAEDVVQEAWLGAVRGIDRFEGRSSLRTWVFRILVNIARTRGVNDHRSVPFTSAFHDDGGPTVDPNRFQGLAERYPGGWRSFPAPWREPEIEVLHGEARDVVRRCLQTLPARQRTVMELRDVLGYDAEEVCSLLDLSSGNQRVLLHRARAAVRRELEIYFTDRVEVEP